MLQGRLDRTSLCASRAGGNSGRTQHDAARLARNVTTRVKATRVIDTTEEEGLDVFDTARMAAIAYLALHGPCVALTRATDAEKVF